MATPKPFKIDISEDQLNDLKQRLSLTRWPDELEDAEWQYGAPLADVRRLAERWQNGYDWRKHERKLNETLPQYTLDIDVEGFETLNIHFVHQRSEKYDAIPLLFVHGCEYHPYSQELTLLTMSSTQGREASSKSRKFYRC